MAAKRLSEFPELVSPQALSEMVVAYNGATYRFKLGNIVGLIPIPTKAQIGLGNVDNTSDLAKPVSAAQQVALDLKSNFGHTHQTSDINGLASTLSTYNDRIVALTDNVSTLSTQVFGLNNTVSSMTGRLTAVETKTNLNEANITNLTSSLNTLTSSVAVINQSVLANTTDIQNLFNNVGLVAARVNTAESSILSLQNSNALLVTEMASLTGSMAAANASIANLTTRVVSSEASINTLITNFNGHESRIVVLENEIIGDVPTAVFTVSDW